MPATPRMFMRISDKDRRLIAGLRHKWGLGDDSETVRAAIRRSAEQEGISEYQGTGPRLMDSWTERARKVMVQAQEEALLLNHDFIGTEHLLLALAGQSDGVAFDVLTNLGVEHSQVREAVERIVGKGKPRSKPTREVGLTGRAKRAMELAVEEAKRSKNQYIGTQHLLLGLLREGEGVAWSVLHEMGVTYEKTKQEVEQVLGREHSSQARQTLSYEQTASQMGQPWHGIAQEWDQNLQPVQGIANPFAEFTPDLEMQQARMQAQAAYSPQAALWAMYALYDRNLQVALEKFVRLLSSPKFQAMLDEVENEDADRQPPEEN